MYTENIQYLIKETREMYKCNYIDEKKKGH